VPVHRTTISTRSRSTTPTTQPSACGWPPLPIKDYGGTANALRKDINEHVLNMANELPKKVRLADCGAIRQDCLAMHDKLIQEPLPKADPALWSALQCPSPKCIEDNGEVVIWEGRNEKH